MEAMPRIGSQKSFGIEAEFYFVDTAKSTDRIWKFMTRSGGQVDSNPVDIDRFTARGSTEMVYTDSNTAPGSLIAGDIVFDWKPGQIYRFPRYAGDDSAQNTSAFVTEMVDGFPEGGNTICWFVTTGHLHYNPPTILPDTTAILKIDVYYDVPKGIPFVDSTMPDMPVPRSNDIKDRRRFDSIVGLHGRIELEHDSEFLYATLLVTKGDLLRPSQLLSEMYRETSISLDLSRCPGCRPGPLFPGQISKSINVRVYWLGGERVALHTLALRDGPAQQILGVDNSLYRARLFKMVQMSAQDDCGEVRQKIYRRADTIRPDSFEYGPYTVIERMLFRARAE